MNLRKRVLTRLPSAVRVTGDGDLLTVLGVFLVVVAGFYWFLFAAPVEISWPFR
jgi:hypothetical protein